MPQKPMIFISYRRQPSDDLARFLYDRLQSAGADVFFDREAINGGRFAAIIEREIINRDYFLVILAPNTLESEWVRREIATALRHSDKVKLIPVTAGFNLGSAALPEEIAELAEYDAIQYEREYADASIERIRKAIGLAEKLTPPPPAPPSGTHIEQHISTMSGGTVIGSQANIGTQPPEGNNEPMPENQPPKGMSDTVKVAIIGGVFALLAAIVGILPNILNSQTPTPSPTDTLVALIASETSAPVIPTDTNTPPVATNTAAPSATSVPSTPIPTSDTPVPASSNTPVQQASPTTPPSDNTSLRLFMDKDTFTLVVTASQPLDVSGLGFGVVINNVIQGRNMADMFAGGLGLTGNIAQPGACYIWRKSGTASPLPSSCNIPNQIFRQDVAPSDVFWYDDLGAKVRDIAIYQDGNSTGQVCAGTLPECTIHYSS
ncbi:MAG: TIR domain-containing protein [Anaerolineaceae bacterium]|nr:TIR domain-containing protein [Anaerolineaceae bacterium]